MIKEPANNLSMDLSALKFHEAGDGFLKMVRFCTSGKIAIAWWLFRNIFVLCV